MNAYPPQPVDQPIDPDFAALARVRMTVWALVITTTLAFAGVSFAVKQHGQEIGELKAKKAEATSVLDKIDALTRLEQERAASFDRRLQAIEEFQRAQAQAAMRAASEAKR